MTERDDEFEQRQHVATIRKNRWIESIKEGHVLAVSNAAPLPAGWRERPDMDNVPAKLERLDTDPKEG